MIIIVALAFILGSFFGLITGGMLGAGKAEDIIRENYLLKRQIESLKSELQK